MEASADAAIRGWVGSVLLSVRPFALPYLESTALLYASPLRS